MNPEADLGRVRSPVPDRRQSPGAWAREGCRREHSAKKTVNAVQARTSGSWKLPEQYPQVMLLGLPAHLKVTCLWGKRQLVVIFLVIDALS